MHLKTLKEWKAAGKIRYIGITHYYSSGYEKMQKILNIKIKQLAKH